MLKKYKILILVVIQIFTIAFTTTYGFAAPTSPTISTVAYKNVTDSSVEIGGRIEKNGGYNIIDCGFYYGTSSSKMLYKTSLGSKGSEKGSFYTTLVGLDPGKKWYYKFYVVNELNREYTSSTWFFYTTDVRLLVDTDAIPGAGHIAILLSTSDGQNRYYSIDNPLLKGKTFVAFTNINKSSLSDVYKSKISDGSQTLSIDSRYDSKFSILGPGSSLSGKLDVDQMNAQAKSFQRKVNDKLVSYNIAPTLPDSIVINDGAGIAFLTKPYNCATFVAEVLNAGGVPYGDLVQTRNPNALASYIIDLMQ